MDTTPEKFRLLGYILSQQNTKLESEPNPDLVLEMPYLAHPAVVQSMADSVPEMIQAHSLLGERSSSDTVDAAIAKIADIESELETGERTKEEVVMDLQVYKAVVKLDEMHQEYDKKLQSVEKRLGQVYHTVVAELGLEANTDQEGHRQVTQILAKVGKGEKFERIDISGMQLKILPPGFGRLQTLLVLHLSKNLLQVLPDSIAGLQKLQELNVSSNLLECFPESIGMLLKLKILNVSGNKLKILTESIAGCSNLEELNASYNNLTCLPVNMGYGLTNLRKLFLYFNKIKFLPSSLCEIESLQVLDAHFNELHGLPKQMGRLMNLELLNVSSNFSDFTAVPCSICDLIKLRELDLSNNQIRYLPDDFFRLESLEKLNVDENPLVIPPLEAARNGAIAVRAYMSKRWQHILVEDQKRRMLASKQSRGSLWPSWNPTWFSGMSESFTAYMGAGKGPKGLNDSFLDQKL